MIRWRTTAVEARSPFASKRARAATSDDAASAARLQDLGKIEEGVALRDRIVRAHGQADGFTRESYGFGILPVAGKQLGPGSPPQELG